MFSIFSLFVILQTIFAQEKFNIFKSYVDSKVKPSQYSREKKHLKITIKEQLHIKSKWLEPYMFNYETINEEQNKLRLLKILNISIL